MGEWEKLTTSTTEGKDEMLVINGRTFSNYAKSVLLDTIEKQMIDHIKEISDFKGGDVFFENLESLTMVLSELAIMHRVIDGSYDGMPQATLKQEAK